MLKKLDKYMDNLKSPYWELILYFIFFIFFFSSLITILIASPELAGKLGNTGSFLGGIIAVLAFPLGVREYLKYTRHRGFQDLNRLQNETIPSFNNEFATHQVNVLSCVSIIAKYDDFKTIKEMIKDIDILSMKKYFINYHFKIEVSINSIICASPHLKKDLEPLKEEFIQAVLAWEQAAIFSYNILSKSEIGEFTISNDIKVIKKFYSDLNKSEIYSSFVGKGEDGTSTFRSNSERLKSILNEIREVT